MHKVPAMATIIKFSLPQMLIILWVVTSAVELQAQSGQTGSGFADASLRAIRNRNSMDRFSTSRITNQIRNRSVTQSGVAGINRRSYLNNSTSQIQKSKPFSGVQKGPAVSPYLALSNPFTSTATSYYTQVRPLAEQRRMQQQQQRQQRVLERQQYIHQKKLNQAAAQGPYSITGSEEFAPTGHAAGYMQLGNFQETGNYFPPPTEPKSR